MPKRRNLRLLSGLLALGLLAAACGDDEDDPEATGGTDGTEQTSDFSACEVTDTGGVDDDSFNETAYNGLVSAAEEVGFEPKVLESTADSDYAPNIDAFLDQECDLIIGVGFKLGDAIKAAAEANPDNEFAIVDYAYDPAIDNVLGLTFATDEAAFLAGYAAAGMTKTGKVGTYGGLKIPTVTIFMEGFEQGVEQYNTDNGKDVELLGWSTDAGDGLFTGDFDDEAKGRSTTESLLDDGADIIMPVAGPVGLGTIAAVQADRDAGGSASVVWVDTDGCVSVADSCHLFLTSVKKNMDVAVHDAVVSASKDEFEGGIYSGTLENDGVGLGDFHEYDDDVPAALKEKLEEYRGKIVSGELKVGADA